MGYGASGLAYKALTPSSIKWEHIILSIQKHLRLQDTLSFAIPLGGKKKTKISL